MDKHYLGPSLIVGQQGSFIVVQYTADGKDIRHLYPIDLVEQVEEERDAANPVPTT